MIRISEWLPNPKGDDSAGEWIEIENAGTSSASLGGWAIAAGKKKFTLRGMLAPGELRVVPRIESSLTLRNQNEKIILYTPAGTVADTSEFAGVAPEGQSFARSGDSFFFTSPTPGASNPIIEIAPVQDLPPILRAGRASPLEVTLSVILGGLAVATAFFFLIIHTHDQGKLFFGRNEADRSGSREPHP